MKGFYHAQKSDLLKATDILASMKHCGQAGTHYLEAAGCYPEDDEQRCYFLHISLNHFFVCSLPTGHILGILEGMQRCFPKMQRLWKISVIAQAGRDDGIKNDLHIGKQIRAAVERGEVKMDACYCLQPTGLTLSDIGQA
ncbi:hypothetical protein PLICRDRAFT_510427 [Plicaturopsis crispa FD-325 SS-3]|nr:hypothetical protein PLICRDRAFT_510427 [Plicaturopsis crispa FD-325 SS-3]